MFARVSWIAMTVIVLFYVYTSAQVVSQACLGCICEVNSGCNISIGCGSNNACGPFVIIRDYWSDAGKPTLNNEPLSDNAYVRCTNDPYCAAGVVESYMSKFGRDCNEDGVVDCDDYMRLHRFGANRCTDPLDRDYEEVYKLCIQTFEAKIYIRISEKDPSCIFNKYLRYGPY